MLLNNFFSYAIRLFSVCVLFIILKEIFSMTLRLFSCGFMITLNFYILWERKNCISIFRLLCIQISLSTLLNFLLLRLSLMLLLLLLQCHRHSHLHHSALRLHPNPWPNGINLDSKDKNKPNRTETIAIASSQANVYFQFYTSQIADKSLLLLLAIDACEDSGGAGGL